MNNYQKQLQAIQAIIIFLNISEGNSRRILTDLSYCILIRCERLNQIKQKSYPTHLTD